MLELGIDEITLVLQLRAGIKDRYGDDFDWNHVAGNIVSRFSEKAMFNEVFGDIQPLSKPPQGYTVAFRFGEHSFYLAVAYHPYHMSMGIVVKFSAQSLDYYCEATGLEVYQFLQLVEDTLYSTRLSRVDLTADYINENINVTNIYKNLTSKKLGIFREHLKKDGTLSFRKCPLEYNGFVVRDEVPTLYIGSKQSNSFLRIYDKRREQIERKGTKVDKALAYDNWVRFEGVFKHDYAHQIHAALLSIENYNDYASLIACTLANKYRFMQVDDGVIVSDVDFTQTLMDCINNNYFALKAPSSRNFELANSLRHMFVGSGIITTLYKIKEIWGDDAIVKIVNDVLAYTHEFKPNADCEYWLKKNVKDYKRNYPDLNSFLDNNFSNILNT